MHIVVNKSKLDSANHYLPTAFRYILQSTRLQQKKVRRAKMVVLLDISKDILVKIVRQVMTPAKEGFRKIVNEKGIRESLLLALTC